MTGIGYYAHLDRGGDELTLGPDDIRSPSFPAVHSGVAEWSFETPLSEALSSWRFADIRVEFERRDGSRDTITRGRVDHVSHGDKYTTLRGQTEGYELKESGGGQVTYQTIAYWEAIADYWANTPFEATVHEPTTEIIQDGETIQAADTQAEWEDVVDESALETIPLAVASDALTTQQAAWLQLTDDDTGGTAELRGLVDEAESEEVWLFSDGPFTISPSRLYYIDDAMFSAVTGNYQNIDSQLQGRIEVDDGRLVVIGAGGTVEAEDGEAIIREDGESLIEDEDGFIVTETEEVAAYVSNGSLVAWSDSESTVLNVETDSGDDVVGVTEPATHTREFQFSPDYTVPNEHAAIGARLRYDDSVGEDVGPVDGYLDGDFIGSFGPQADTFVWRFQDLSDQEFDGDLEAGETYTLEFRKADFDDWDIELDVVAPHDSRYSWTFDNEVDANNLLDGPETYPDAVSTDLDSVENAYNIVSAALTATIPNTVGEQALAVSNDGGDSYPLTATNSETLSGDFDDPGRVARIRPTLGRWPVDTNEGRDTDSPRLGYNPQTIESFELAVTADDLRVIHDREFSGSHRDIIDELHDRGGMRYVFGHDGAGTVESFAKGDIVREGEWTLNRESPSWGHTTRDYANVITVLGPFDDHDGKRFEVTVESNAEIERLMDLGYSEEQATIERVVIETQTDDPRELQAIAVSELANAIEEDDLEADVQIVPTQIAPGYDYYIPSLEKTLSLERVEFDDGSSPAGTLEFQRSPRVSTSIRRTDREVARTKRSIRR